MVFKCLLGASHLNIAGSKSARSQHRWAARGPGGSTRSTSPLQWAPPVPQPAPTCVGRAAANRLGGRTLCPSPSPPATCLEHRRHLPFQLPKGVPREGSPWPSWAGRAELRASTQHRVVLWQLLLSNTNRATTRTLEADTIAARRESSGREPGVPTRPRPAGRCRCPAPSWESTTRSSSLAGQSGEKVVLFKVVPRSAMAGGLGGAGDQLCTPGWPRSPRSLLSSSLQPDAGKLSVSIPALSSLLLPTFVAAALSWAPSLSATCPGAPSKAACVSSCLEKEQGGRKGMDSVGRAKQRRGVSVHPAAWGKGRRMFCNNLASAFTGRERKPAGQTVLGEPSRPRNVAAVPVPEPLGRTPGSHAVSCWGPTGVML